MSILTKSVHSKAETSARPQMHQVEAEGNHETSKKRRAPDRTRSSSPALSDRRGGVPWGEVRPHFIPMGIRRAQGESSVQLAVVQCPL